MIRLDQIRALESKINKAVERIQALREENLALKKTLDSAQMRMQELEKLVEEFKADQDEIEKAVLRAIKNLEHLEDHLTEPLLPGQGKQKDAQASSQGPGLPFEEKPGNKNKKEVDLF